MTGIYMIKNEINNKIYIGKSMDINKRWVVHEIMLIDNKHGNTHLQNSWNKYGMENFIFKIIEECNEQILNEKEKYWIEFYKSYNPQFGYNKTKGGDGGDTFNYNPNKETIRLKLSKLSKGRTPWNKGIKNCFSSEVCEKISNALKNVKKSNEHIEKMKNNKNALGYKHTELAKLKISAATTGNNNPFYGKKHSEETKNKISKSHKGKHFSWNKTKINEEQIIKVDEMINNNYSKAKIVRELNISLYLLEKILQIIKQRGEQIG